MSGAVSSKIRKAVDSEIKGAKRRRVQAGAAGRTVSEIYGAYFLDKSKKAENRRQVWGILSEFLPRDLLNALESAENSRSLLGLRNVSISKDTVRRKPNKDTATNGPDTYDFYRLAICTLIGSDKSSPRRIYFGTSDTPFGQAMFVTAFCRMNLNAVFDLKARADAFDKENKNKRGSTFSLYKESLIEVNTNNFSFKDAYLLLVAALKCVPGTLVTEGSFHETYEDALNACKAERSKPKVVGKSKKASGAPAKGKKTPGAPAPGLAAGSGSAPKPPPSLAAWSGSAAPSRPPAPAPSSEVFPVSALASEVFPASARALGMSPAPESAYVMLPPPIPELVRRSAEEKSAPRPPAAATPFCSALKPENALSYLPDEAESTVYVSEYGGGGAGASYG